MSKSTQDEDKELQQRINNTVIKLLIKREQEALLSTCKEEESDNNAFVDGSCAMLRGMNAAMYIKTCSQLNNGPLDHNA